MTRTQQWNRDTALEHMAAEFLDNHFYSSNIFGKAKVTRYSDTYHQFGGIDVRINETNFDEKFKIKGCLNLVQEFPCNECTIINKAGDEHIGWFLNDSLSTDYYTLIAISASVPNDNQLTSVDQISAADVLWVNKQDLKDYVYSYISKDELSNDVDELRRMSDKTESGAFDSMPDCLGYNKSRDGKYRKRYQHKKFWLTYSSHMDERPVNLIMPRATLESLPHSRHFIVTKDKVRKA